MANNSPASARLQVASGLRQMRHDAGMTMEQARDMLMCSYSKMSRIELGELNAAPRDVRDLCQFYGADEATTAAMMGLARAARQKDEWAITGAGRSGLYLSLEQGAATAITAFSMCHIPALLQTAGYAEALTGVLDRDTLPVRQKLLTREDAPQCRFILDEAVLHRRPGATVMAAQLGELLELAATVTVNLVPFDAGVISGLDSNFTILEFGDTLTPMVFTEHLTGYAEHPTAVDHYREVAQMLLERALSPDLSVQQMGEMRDYWSRQAAK